MFNFYKLKFMLDIVPKSKNKNSNQEVLKKRQPNLSYWDCLDYIWILDPKRIELTSRAYECVFIEYAINSETYMFYDLNVKVIIE